MADPRMTDPCPENNGKEHWYDGGICYVCGADEPDWQAQIDALVARLAEAERHLNDYWQGATTFKQYVQAMRAMFPIG